MEEEEEEEEREREREREGETEIDKKREGVEGERLLGEVVFG